MDHLNLSLIPPSEPQAGRPPWEPLTPAELRTLGNALWEAFDYVQPTLIKHATEVDLRRFRHSLNAALAALRGQ